MILKKTRKLLDELKLNPQESDDDVMMRLLKNWQRELKEKK